MFKNILIGIALALRLERRSAVSETRSVESKITRFAQCLRVIVISVIVASAAGVLVAPTVTHANESASYRLYHTTFPGYSSGCPSKSGSFCMVEKGITWNKLPLVGSSFQIVTAPPVEVAVVPPEEEPLPEPGPGPGGCRGRGCRERPPRPAAPPEPEPPVTPPVEPPVLPTVVPPVEPEPTTPTPVPTPPVVPTIPIAEVPPELVPIIVQPPFIIVDYYDETGLLCKSEKAEPLHAAAVPFRRVPVALLLIGYLLLFAALVTRRWHPNEYYDHALHRGKTPEYWKPYPSNTRK